MKRIKSIILVFIISLIAVSLSGCGSLPGEPFADGPIYSPQEIAAMNGSENISDDKMPRDTPSGVTILNGGYVVGRKMSSSSLELYIEASGAESYTYQWQWANSENGEYTAIEGATSAVLSCNGSTLVNGKWYRCVVNGVNSRPVMALKGKTSSATAPDGTSIPAFDSPMSEGYWYVSNNTMAYCIGSDYHFDIVGIYGTNASNMKWINTSYMNTWNLFADTNATPEGVSYEEHNATGIQSFKAYFDPEFDVTIYFKAELKSGYHSFAFGCDSELHNNDSCCLGATLDQNGKLYQTMLIGTSKYADANDDTPAFVILPNSDVSHYWIGQYSNALYWGNNPSGSGVTQVGDFKNSAGVVSRNSTLVENVDSNLTMSWNNLEDGAIVGFQFNVGSAGTTGALAGAAKTKVQANEIGIDECEPVYYYALFKKATGDETEDSRITDWFRIVDGQLYVYDPAAKEMVASDKYELDETGQSIAIKDLTGNTFYYVVNVLIEDPETKEPIAMFDENGDIDLTALEEGQYVKNDDLLTAIYPLEPQPGIEEFYRGEDGIEYQRNVNPFIERGVTRITLKNAYRGYKFALKKENGQQVTEWLPVDEDGNVVFTGLDPDTGYVLYAQSVSNPENVCEPIATSTLPEGGRADREPYIIGPDGYLPQGLLYGEIDYDTDFIEDTILFAKDADGNHVKTTYINLTQEKFVTDFNYSYYSINNGKTWTKATKKIDNKKLQSLLNKGFQLCLADGYDKKTKKAVGTILRFEKIAKRPSVPKYKVNYGIYADPSGLTNGMWTISIEGMEANMRGYWIGIADSTGKTIGENGYGLWPYMDGVWVQGLQNGKQCKAKYYIKTASFGNTPSCKVKKITVSGVGKPTKTKVNYTYETISLQYKNVCLFAGAMDGLDENKTYINYIEDTRADKEKLIKSTDTMPFESIEKITGDMQYSDLVGKLHNGAVERLVKLELSNYITADSRNVLVIWKPADSDKPATEKQIVELVKAAPVPSVEPILKNGSVKLKLNKSVAYQIDVNGKWKTSVPKTNQHEIYKIRQKMTVKAGKESDTTYATGAEGYLVLEYGEYNSKIHKMGYVNAYLFETLEEAEAKLATLPDVKAATPTPTVTPEPTQAPE